MTKGILLANWIMAPDGTMIPSFHTHDYRSHTTVDTWKRRSKKMVDHELVPDLTRKTVNDGGLSYRRRMGQFIEMSVFSTDPFEVIRRFVCRGGRGVDGDKPLTNVPLFRIDDEWLENIILYEAQNRPDNIYLPYYRLEQIYRKEHNIKINKK